MGKAVETVAGVVAAGAAVVFGGAGLLLAGAIGVGAAAAVRVIGDALVPETETFDDPKADQSLITDSNQPRRIIYGSAKVGGQIVGYTKVTEGDKDYHYLAIHIAGHVCDSVTLNEIEGKTPAEFAGKVTAEYHLGTQITANTMALNNIVGWTAQHIGFGLTNAYLKIEDDPELFPGLNDITFIIKGKKVYDVRKDTTKGGSGAHRVDDPTTWEWSECPPLCAYDYARLHGHRPIPERRIPWDFVALTANYCDELVTFDDVDGFERTEKRFTCNGVLKATRRPGENLRKINSSMGATVFRPNGRLYIKPSMYIGPATFTIHAKDFKTQPNYQPHRPLKERVNIVSAEYVEPALKHQVTDAAVIDNPIYIAQDKSNLPHRLQLHMTQRRTMANRLQTHFLERSRAGFIAELPLMGFRFDAVPGAVGRFIDPEYSIDKEFVVKNYQVDFQNLSTLIALEEDGEAIYPSGFKPAETDLTPNTTLPDPRLIAPVENLAYTATPTDSWRLGKVDWTHPVPSSVTAFVAELYDISGATPQILSSLETVAPQYDVANVPSGNYRLLVKAYGRFTAAPSVAQIDFAAQVQQRYKWTVYADDINGLNISVDDDTKPYVGYLLEQLVATPDTSNPGAFAYFPNTAAQFLIGTGEPAPALGNVGDTYINQATGDIYKKGQAGWGSPVGNFAPGDGDRWLSGSSIPAAGIGADGDWYLRTGTYDVYQKVGGTWEPRGALKGADGLTSYLHVRYANNANGTSGFNTTSGTYRGEYTSFSATASNDPANYTWNLIKGADGANGQDGQNADAVVANYLTQWRFNNSLRNWTLNDGVHSYVRNVLHVEVTGTNPRLNSPTFVADIDGAENPVVRVRMRTTSANHTANMIVFYATRDNNAHGFSSSYRKEFTVDFVQNEWVYVSIDMDQVDGLDANDWIESAQIYRLRFDFAGIVGNHYELDNLVIGYYGAGDETDYFDPRINTILELPEDANTTFGDIKLYANRLPTGAIASQNGEVGISAGKFLKTNGGYEVLNNEILVTTPFEGTLNYVGVFYIVFSEQLINTRFGSDFGTTKYFAATVIEYEDGTETWRAWPNTGDSVIYTPSDTDIVLAICMRKSRNALAISSLKNLLKPLAGIDNQSLSQGNILAGAGWNQLPESGANVTGISNIVSDPSFENEWIHATGPSPLLYISNDGENGSKSLRIDGAIRTSTTYAWIRRNEQTLLQVPAKAGDRFKVRVRYKATTDVNGGFGCNLLPKKSDGGNVGIYPNFINQGQIVKDNQFHTIEARADVPDTSTLTAYCELYFYATNSVTSGSFIVDSIEMWKIPASLDNDDVDAPFIRNRFGWLTNPADGATRNVGALADLDDVDLSNPSRVRNQLPQANADYLLWNERMELTPDGFMSYRDQNGQSVNLGSVSIGGLGYSGALDATRFEAIADPVEGRARFQRNGVDVFYDVFSASGRTEINYLRQGRTPNNDAFISNRQIAGGTVQYALDIRHQPNGWPNNTNINGADDYNFDSSATQEGHLYILASDAEGTKVGLNGGEIGSMAGPDNAVMWHSFAVDLVAGQNTVSVWASNADGGSVLAIVVSANGPIDPEATLNANPDKVNALADSRIGSLRPDSSYKNSNTTKSQVGLGSVDNKSSVTLRDEAIAQAKLEALLRNNSGSGINFFNGDYQDPDTRQALSKTGASSGSYISTFDGYGQPSKGNTIRLEASGTDAYIYLGKSSSDYNIQIPVKKKWIFSAWVYSGNNAAHVKSIQLYLRLSDGSHHVVNGTSGPAFTWKRIHGVIDLTSKDVNRCIARLDLDDTTSGIAIFDQIMLEPLVHEGSETPSEYSLPISESRVRNQRTLPALTNVGASSAMNINPLSSSANGATARINIAAHTLRDSQGTISYNAGTISGLAYNTFYYVYCDDFNYAGGAVTYLATTDIMTLASDSSRRYIARIATPTNNASPPVDPEDDNCVDAQMWLTDLLQAKNAKTGDIIDVWTEEGAIQQAPIEAIKHGLKADCVRIETVSGCQVICSIDTPITRFDSTTFKALNALGEFVYVCDKHGQRWEQVKTVKCVGVRNIVRLSVGDISFAAGVDSNKRVVTHNATVKP